MCKFTFHDRKEYTSYTIDPLPVIIIDIIIERSTIYTVGSRKNLIIMNLSTVVLTPPLLFTYTLVVIFFMNFLLILSALPVIHS